MVFINIIGGTTVLGSYIYGVLIHSGAADILWGGVPQSIHPFYTAGMFMAATGYFAFTYYILFRLNPRNTRLFHRFGFGVFNALYAVILIPSALWMPLTFSAVEQSNPGLLWAVRIVLAAVGLASLVLLLALWNVEQRKPLWTHRIAIVGSVSFCIQTGLLDAILWGVYF